MKKRILGIVLKYGIGVALLTWVVWSHWDMQSPDGEPIGLSAAFSKPIHYQALLLTIGVVFVAVAITLVRWFLLVRAQQLPVTFSNAMRLGMLGFFYNIFIPGSVGGDLVKGTMLVREQSRRTVAAATVLLDRVIGLCGLIWLTALTSGVFWAFGFLETWAASDLARTVLQSIAIGAWVLVLCSLVFWIALGMLTEERANNWAVSLQRVRKIGVGLAEFWRAVWMYRCRSRTVGLALLMSLVSHSGFVLAFYFAACTLTPAYDLPSFATHFFIVPVGNTIQSGFPTPNGMGGGEFAYGQLYQLLGFAFVFGVLGSLIIRAVMWTLGVAGFVAYGFVRVQPQPSSESDPEKSELAVS